MEDNLKIIEENVRLYKHPRADIKQDLSSYKLYSNPLRAAFWLGSSFDCPYESFHYDSYVWTTLIQSVGKIYFFSPRWYQAPNVKVNKAYNVYAFLLLSGPK